jgi:fructokinase
MTTTTPTIVVGLGEVLWDCFPDERRPGGAPANFAFHARQLGFAGEVCARIGDDLLGREFSAYLAQHGLSDRHLQIDPEHETGRVDVAFDDDRQPSYTFVEDAAWDYFQADPPALALMREASAVCFGTLAQRRYAARDAIHRCLDAAPAGCTIIYDVNLRPPWFEAGWIEHSLRAADVVKLNDAEQAELTRMLALDIQGDGAEARCAFARALQQRYDVELVCITRGAQGAFVADRLEQAETPGEEIQLVDPVGAGDAFTAALYYGWRREWPLPTVATLANRFAGLVASRSGAMPDLSAELPRLLARVE